MERLAALKKKYSIEAQEEKLRKEKKKLSLETELAATNAKLHVLKINSVCSSERSDGMNSYFKRGHVQEAPSLNPCADTFVPAERDYSGTNSAF